MSAWSLYFLAKLLLFSQGQLAFAWAWNLLLAIAVAWPVPRAPWQRARTAVAFFLALLLFASESPFGMSSPDKALQTLKAVAGFSGEYLLELAARLLTPRLLGMAACAMLGFALLARYLRMSTLAILGILSVPLWTVLGLQGASGADSAGAAAESAALPAATERLRAFYTEESKRRLSLASPGGVPPFDLVLLHVCSLSWDDLDFARQRNHALFRRFDVVFSHFNSAASYSGPAGLRVLRGTCGQTPHRQLYDAGEASCYVFPSLERAGYRTQALLNHNGLFDDFAKVILGQRSGLSGKLLDNRGAPQHLQAFDGSPIYADGSLLSHWWTARQASAGAPVALYYNTITLHDGNRGPAAGPAATNSLQSYSNRLSRLLDDFDAFLAQLAASGRPVVVMLIPEHGAALRADGGHVAGLREIPGPDVTLVPAAVKLVGLPRAAGAEGASRTLLIDQPISYFGLYTLLADLLMDSPFRAGATPLDQRVRNLPLTTFVSENDDVVVMQNPEGEFLIKSADGVWLPLRR